MLRQRTPLKRKTPLTRGGRLSAMSSRRKVESQTYSRLRKKFLAENPWCQICEESAHESQGKSTVHASQDVHHKHGRLGGNYLNVKTWMAVCRFHHLLIHDYPAHARKRGWLV